MIRFPTMSEVVRTGTVATPKADAKNSARNLAAYSAHRLPFADLDDHADRYAARITALRDGLRALTQPRRSCFGRSCIRW